ncbi:MAG: hypothetical protein WBX19_07370 [Terracidiphilus sp.]
MMDHRTALPASLIAPLRDAVLRMEQSENPQSLLLMKHFLLDRIAELEEEAELEELADS